MRIPDTTTLRVVLLRSGYEFAGAGRIAGTVLDLPRDIAMAGMRAGNFDLVPQPAQPRAPETPA